MFLTPVVYPLPAGHLGAVMHANPLTPLFTVTRELLYGGVGPMVGSFAFVWVATFLFAGLAWVVYRLAVPILVERLEA
jgi:lipopolysaccharide transport system permease protein